MSMDETIVSCINDRIRLLESRNLEERDRFLTARKKAKTEKDLQMLIDGLMPTVNEFYETRDSLEKYEWLVNACNEAYQRLSLCNTDENRERYRKAYLTLLSYQTKLYNKYCSQNTALAMKK